MSALALVAVVSGVSTVQAEETSAAVDAGATIQVDTSPIPRLTPPSKSVPAVIRAEVKNRMELKKDNLKADIKDVRAEAKARIDANRDMFKRTTQVRKEIIKKMEARTFETRKMALVKELKMSLINLANISTRIEARITKAESEGRTMTDAKALLVTAKEKLAKAQADVAAFEALPAPTPDTTAEVDLTRPRVLGDAAIKSVKDAREAFKKVVTAIAHAMGLKADVKVEATTSVSPVPTTN